MVSQRIVIAFSFFNLLRAMDLGDQLTACPFMVGPDQPEKKRIHEQAKEGIDQTTRSVAFDAIRKLKDSHPTVGSLEKHGVCRGFWEKIAREGKRRARSKRGEKGATETGVNAVCCCDVMMQLQRGFRSPRVVWCIGPGTSTLGLRQRTRRLGCMA